MDEIEWIIIEGLGNREIGAVGIVGGKVAVVTAFYDDLDGNMDGKVSWGEWLVAKLSPLSLENKAVVEVAMAARNDLRVIERDQSFYEEAARMFLAFATGLVADGLYAAYFSRGVQTIVKPIAGRITGDLVKQFVIRKGMEKAIKATYDRTMKPAR